jgi:hypothetical protein
MEWQNYNKIIKKNLYWREDRKQIKFLKYTFDEWRKLEGVKDIWYTPRMDEGSRIADPQFVDPKNRDFRLKPGSPAFALGFQEWDMAQAGLYGPPAWKELPASCPVQPLLATERGLGKQFFKFYEDGFELEAPGEKPALVEILEAEKGFLCVTDEKAVTGRNSLKFVDAAGLAQYHLPHMFYRPNLFDSVRMRLSFDLYREPGAMLWVEWRDYEGCRQTGPSIRIQADGKLLLDQTPTDCRIPDRAWTHIEMTDGLGKLADGRWELKITVKDKVLFERKDIPCDAGFASVQWLGFVSYGTAPAVFYIDNVSYKMVER